MATTSSTTVVCAFPRCSIKLKKFHQMQLKKLMEKEEEDSSRCNAVVSDGVDSSMSRIQKMNNASASLIENGRYDKAIAKLRKPLEILKAVEGINMKHSCDCCDCSLDACIEFSSSEEEDSYFIQLDLIDGVSTNIKKVKTATNNNGIEEGGDFHTTPLFIPKKVIREGNHNMGSRLFLILTFNLALARHLKVVKKTKNKKNSIKNTIKLYKIVLDVMKLDDDNVASTTMTNSQQFIRLVQQNLNHLNDHYLAIVSKEEENNAAVASASLYEQHKELLRTRFSTTATQTESSSSLNLVSEKSADDGFSLRLKNAMRTSSSFEHLQPRRDVRIAQAA